MSKSITIAASVRPQSSAAIAQSWTDKSVRAARSLKQKVVVGKYEYRSVRAAFADLGLPDSQRIAFRQELKAAGVAKFARHTFHLIAAA